MSLLQENLVDNQGTYMMKFVNFLRPDMLKITFELTDPYGSLKT